MKSFFQGSRVSHCVSLAIVALALSAGTVHAGRTQVSSIGHHQTQRSESFTENRPVVITPRLDLIRDKGQPGTTPDLSRDARNEAPVAPASNFMQWAGSEQLAGFGKLSFQPNTDARAVMIDAQEAAEGTWQRTVDRITLQFAGVVYAGTLNGSSFSGTASDGETSWTWSVQFQAAGSVTNTKTRGAGRDSTATITLVGTENLEGFGRLEFCFVPPDRAGHHGGFRWGDRWYLHRSGRHGPPVLPRRHRRLYRYDEQRVHLRISNGRRLDLGFLGPVRKTEGLAR